MYIMSAITHRARTLRKNWESLVYVDDAKK